MPYWISSAEAEKVTLATNPDKIKILVVFVNIMHSYNNLVFICINN